MDATWIWVVAIFILFVGIVVFALMFAKKRCEALDRQIAQINMSTPPHLREAAIRDAKLSSSCTSERDKEDLRIQRDIDNQCRRHHGHIDQMCASNIRERHQLDRERRQLNRQKNQVTFGESTTHYGPHGSDTSSWSFT